MIEPAVLALIPPVLRPIAEALGLSVALDVAKKLGGQRLMVPNKPRPGQRMVEAIGIEATCILAEHFAGNISIPRAWRLLAELRAREIQNDPRSANQVAAAYDMTERQVRNIRNRPPIGLQLDRRRDDRQLDLIDVLNARTGTASR